MSNFLEIKIYDKIYVQRKEFGKIQEFTLDGTKLNTYEELPTAIQKIINLSLDMEQHPEYFFYYCEVKNGIRVTGIKNNPDIDKFVRIPDIINGKPVVEIGSGNQSINQVTYGRIEQIQIPDTVTKFNNKCFSMMYSLKLVNTPAALKSLGSRCFEDCEKLIEFDASQVIDIGAGCFRNCTNIKELDFSSAKLSSEALCGCINLHTVKLSDSLSYIPATFAYNCKSLVNINLPDSIDCIYDFAFLNCEKLNIEKMPSNLKTICNKAFSGSGIKRLVLLQDVKIEQSAFFRSALEYIELGKGVTIDRETFGQCNNLKEMKIHGKFANKELLSTNQKLLLKEDLKKITKDELEK